MNTDKRHLQNAIAEIRQLRKQNEVLSARLSGFDDALFLLRATPVYPSTGMGEDLTYILEKRVAEIEHEESREKWPTNETGDGSLLRPLVKGDRP